MKTPKIEDIEKYSCETYGVTMEQVKEKQTRRKQPLKAKRLILYMVIEYDVMSNVDTISHYSSSYDIVNRAYWGIAQKRKDDLELNSVITEFENKLK